VDRISLVNGLSRNVTSAELQPSVSSDVFYITGIALSNEITSPDIQLTKYVSAVSGGDANTVETGDTVQYTITATNNGQANASNLIIRDDLGADLTLVSSTATDCASVPAGDVCKNLGALNAGATTSFTITGTVTGASQSTTGKFDNFATATFDGPLGSQTAQSQIVTLSYGPVGIDLASQVGFTTDFVQAGKSTTITASVTNLGPSADTNPSLELVAQDGAQMTVANVPAGCAITATTTMLCNATALGISANQSISLQEQLPQSHSPSHQSELPHPSKSGPPPKLVTPQLIPTPAMTPPKPCSTSTTNPKPRSPKQKPRQVAHQFKSRWHPRSQMLTVTHCASHLAKLSTELPKSTVM
jgi:uncharacterized repeat protein (TIGR01451 family)